jgi:Uma2 family endonuclease
MLFVLVMNKPLLTRAAEGLDRWGWTNKKIRALIDADLIEEDAPFELIRGEMVPVAAQLNDHFKMRTRIWRHLTIALEPTDPAQGKIIVASEPSLFLFDDTELKPDVALFPEHLRSEDVRGPLVLLAIEVASSSQRRDLVVKPPIYAEAGVQELWVVDLDEKETHVHRLPKGKAYALVSVHGFGETIFSIGNPHIPVRIADFL